MQHNTDIPPRSLTADEVRRTRDFIRISKGIRQLAGARLYAILLLSSLPDTEGLPELEISKVEELLRTSDLIHLRSPHGVPGFRVRTAW